MRGPVRLPFIQPLWLLVSLLLLPAIALIGCVGKSASFEPPLKGEVIVVRGPHAYLAVGSTLQVIDVSIPTTPTLLSEVATGMQSNLLVSTSNRVYSVNLQYPSTSRGTGKMINIIDASSPLSMGIVGGYEPTDMDEPWVNDVTVLDDTIYTVLQSRKGATEFERGLLALDARDPRNLTQLAFDTTMPVGQITAVDGSTIYAADRDSVRILRLDSVPPLVETGYVCKNCQVSNIAVDGSNAYLYEWTKGEDEQFTLIISSYDVRNPVVPVRKGRYEITGIYGDPYTLKHSASFMLQGANFYTTDNDGNLRIFALQGEGHISEIGSLDPSGWIRDVFILENIAYLAVDYDGMRIVDISNPARPKQIAYYNILGYTPIDTGPTVRTELGDTTPPTGTIQIHGGYAIGAAPDSLVEVRATFIATDTQSAVTHMRLSYDGVDWHEWVPYTYTHTIMIPIPSNWVTFRLYAQYADAAGNVSDVCVGEQLTEGW
jgi:hypothetical protein